MPLLVSPAAAQKRSFMPIRLLLTLLVAAFAVVFAGFNLDNKCNVWLFRTFEMVPVAITIIISLLTGVIIMLPFTIGKRGKKKEKPAEAAVPAIREEPAAPARKEKKQKRGFWKDRGDKNASAVADAVPAPEPEPVAEAAAPVPESPAD